MTPSHAMNVERWRGHGWCISVKGSLFGEFRGKPVLGVSRVWLPFADFAVFRRILAVCVCDRARRRKADDMFWSMNMVGG